MCGITGIYAFNDVGRYHLINLAQATHSLALRGPDHQDIFHDGYCGLGHRRLSIIDTSSAGNQPMSDPTGRYTIVFNGEIYNYQELRQKLTNRGITFQSQSDTEILLHLYIHEKEDCLSQLNGFFTFAVYDAKQESLFIARDRIGIKPLLIYRDEDKVLFASEMKSLLAYGIPKEIDETSLYFYFQLNYIPAPKSIFRGVSKLLPGHYIKITGKEYEEKEYYKIPYDPTRYTATSYEEQQSELEAALEKSVQRRLVSDVPLGSFLSGGIDSSIIAALANRHVDQLHTFSIGYKDEPFYDETSYAQLVADKLSTEHTVFSLSNSDLYSHLHSILDYIDEPFADSSQIPVYILSNETRKKVKVALSGDGADEIFSGYNKHAAALRALQPGVPEKIIGSLLPLWKALPKSRSNPLANRVRQLEKFAHGMHLSEKERYWSWALWAQPRDTIDLLHEDIIDGIDFEAYDQAKACYLKSLGIGNDINDILRTDVDLVLTNDMLVKVDNMSMANGLEVRVPFLDHEIVELAFRLPQQSKIDHSMRKKILQDTFRSILPKELYNRPKHGFEVPLVKWLRTELRSEIQSKYLDPEFIREQKIFSTSGIDQIKTHVLSSRELDANRLVWAIIVFQHWWHRWMT